MSITNATLSEHWITTNEGWRQLVWLVVPPGSGPFPAVVWNHGSQIGIAANDRLIDRSNEPQVSGDGGPWRAWSAAARLALIIPEGRGYAGSGGPRLIDIIQDPAQVMAFLDGRARDAVAATHWACQRPEIDASRILVSGVSHGGAVSLFASVQYAYVGTLIQASGLWYRRPNIGLSTLRAAAAAGWGPLIVQHMMTDSLVSPAVSRAIHDSALASGRVSILREYPGVPGIEGHNMGAPENRAQWLDDYNHFVDQFLGRR